jgi:hypothetical protein
MSPDNTARKQVGRPFEPGQSGNPAGRPKGPRNKLSEAFIADLVATWEEHGRTVLNRIIAEAPTAYVRVIAGVVPRELNVKDEGPFAAMSDEDLDKAIAALLEVTEADHRANTGDAEAATAH